VSTTIQNWGNSLGVRLPKEVTDKLGLRKGSVVNIIVNGEWVMLKPTRKHDTLAEMVSKITKKNRHSEYDWGKPVGKEIW